jgi:hypothetical protein
MVEALAAELAAAFNRALLPALTREKPLPSSTSASVTKGQSLRRSFE